MEIDWHRVAVSLNSAGHRDLDSAGKRELPEAAKEYRIRAFILISLANALFDGLDKRPSPQST